MIYLDNNATTQIAPEVFDAMKPYLADFYGNPSSAHTFGRDMRQAISTAREHLAGLIGADFPDEIAFTSGGTESDNWAIFGALEGASDKRHIVTTRVEHDAVKKPFEFLEKKGYAVTWLDVGCDGRLDLDQLKTSVNENTALVSVMLANNETGIIFPVDEVADIVKERSSALFHVDGVNAVGKFPVDLKKTDIDLFSISAHKFHGPKGIGALYIRRGTNLPPFMAGGGQEMGRRSGTEPVHQVAGIGKAAELAAGLPAMSEVARLRDKLEDAILDGISNATLNGTTERGIRLPNTASISFEDTNGEAILAKLNNLGVCVSTGSACSSDSHSASAVLQAMDIPYKKAMGSIRFSLGRYNTEADIDFVIDNLPAIISDLRAIGL